MIELIDFGKDYGDFRAVESLNLKIGAGEMFGFIGPNGAGKSTTMKILTSYMPPTSGRASIAGFDVFEQSLEARQRLGYLPENTPLYTDMRVNEYLRYRASLKGVTRSNMSDFMSHDASHLFIIRFF